ncbi:MAG: 2,3,4,5-tetrahydropyridine-2,6-dicarboxylate N-succinyltransferase [Spongiibacteraceae bacterium]|jgi:2,3,4,5-tetrahydropyridine-2-carboxylate N-succinyltransferase|nr:2,3,4,5-tetrahydropyridine-2,6-dicarboxylate N-succinyltransferase [Spongiibacteraceae bacterium]
MTAHFALGLGIGTHNAKDEWLEVFYPQPVLNPDTALAALFTDTLACDGNTPVLLDNNLLAVLRDGLQQRGEERLAQLAGKLLESDRPRVALLLRDDSAPRSVPEIYLKLHLLSHRLVRPHQLDLTGMFTTLPNVAWTSHGAIDVAELPARQLAARLEGQTLQVFSVDKFPKMSDYVVPSGVRIADTARVRLGAWLGEGTTIMHEGFVNFNAGTEGPGMVEGRISAGVIVGKGSDLGGGCSTMGTLSGGNDVIISIGEGCLIGANAGVGIPLGDRCTVEAGLYITGGAVVTLLDEACNPVRQVKARELAGQPDLLFRRNSQSGAIEVLTNKSAIALNEALHSNN